MNKCNTQDICPKGERCNHSHPDECRQAALESDHRKTCPKGALCDGDHRKELVPDFGRRLGPVTVGTKTTYIAMGTPEQWAKLVEESSKDQPE